MSSMQFEYTAAEDPPFNQPECRFQSMHVYTHIHTCAFKLLLDNGDTLNGTTNEIQNIKWNTSYFCGLNKSFQLNSEGTEGQMAEVMIPYIRVQVFALPASGNFTEGTQKIRTYRSDN